MGKIELSKQLYLADFVRILEPRIVIRKHMGAVGPGHFVQ